MRSFHSSTASSRSSSKGIPSAFYFPFRPELVPFPTRVCLRKRTEGKRPIPEFLLSEGEGKPVRGGERGEGVCLATRGRVMHSASHVQSGPVPWSSRAQCTVVPKFRPSTCNQRRGHAIRIVPPSPTRPQGGRVAHSCIFLQWLFLVPFRGSLHLPTERASSLKKHAAWLDPIVLDRFNFDKQETFVFNGIQAAVRSTPYI